MCLSQLSLTDTTDPRESFLFQLSQKKGLEYFEHVFLLASQQDKYAPFHSARIENHKDVHTDKKRGAVLYLNAGRFIEINCVRKVLFTKLW